MSVSVLSRLVSRFTESELDFIERVQPVRTMGFASRFGLSERQAFRRLMELRRQGRVASREVHDPERPRVIAELEWKVVQPRRAEFWR